MLNNILIIYRQSCTKSTEETNNIYLFQMQTHVNSWLYVTIQTVPTDTQFKPGLDKSMFAIANVSENSLKHHSGKNYIRFLLGSILELSIFLSIVQEHGHENRNA